MKKELFEKAAAIMGIAMEINSSPTKSSLTGDKPTVFIDFSGHVSNLTIRIFSTGWKANTTPDRRYEIYIAEEDSEVFYYDKFEESQTVNTEYLIDEAFADLCGLKMRCDYMEDNKNVNV